MQFFRGLYKAWVDTESQTLSPQCPASTKVKNEFILNYRVVQMLFRRE